MPKHAWETTVADAMDTEEPATTLYAADVSVDVSGGETVYESREEGAFATTVANSDFYWKGTNVTQYSDGTVQLGDIEVTIGRIDFRAAAAPRPEPGCSRAT